MAWNTLSSVNSTRGYIQYLYKWDNTDRNTFKPRSLVRYWPCFMIYGQSGTPVGNQIQSIHSHVYFFAHKTCNDLSFYNSSVCDFIDSERSTRWKFWGNWYEVIHRFLPIPISSSHVEENTTHFSILCRVLHQFDRLWKMLEKPGPISGANLGIHLERYHLKT